MNKKSLEFSKNFYYSKGKDLKRGIVERLIRQMISKGTLVERIKRNSMGFSWNYLSTGKRIVGKVEMLIDNIELLEKPINEIDEKRNINNKTSPLGNVSKKKVETLARKKKQIIIDDDVTVVSKTEAKRKLNRFQ